MAEPIRGIDPARVAANLQEAEAAAAGRAEVLVATKYVPLEEMGALAEAGVELDVVDFSEHAIGHGADAQAAAYLECRTSDGRTVFGVGLDPDVATASVRAALSAANRA